MVAQLDKEYLLQRPARALSRLVSYGMFEGRPLTTRGRWINSWLIKYFHHTGATDSAPYPTYKIDRPLFILGTGRSGTTVLGKILSLHREVGWLNEPKLLWHIACPHEDLNGNYTQSPARYRLGAEDVSPSIRHAIRSLYATYLKTTRNSRVLDKYPELVFRIPFIKQIFPDARFLLLVRDGYDTCRSIAQWSATHGDTHNSGGADWWGTNDRKWSYLVDQLVKSDPELGPYAEAIAGFSDQMARAAVEWDLTMREGLKLQSLYPDDIMRVKYETLTESPASCVQKILEFGELAEDKTVLNYATNVLRPVSKKDPIALPSIISQSFEKTMQRLGYKSD
jgi:hypothetical protein